MAAPTVNVKLPGRLGDPALEMRSDPRSDPRMVAAFAPFGLDVTAPTPPVTRHSPVADLLAAAAATEQAFDTVFSALLADVPTPEGVESRTETITGVVGNVISRYLDRPGG
ncbi:MAG: acetyl esterase, partial [Mycobacterium sp.]|nr:acetyl esterase [Mycobacterium sp.]